MRGRVGFKMQIREYVNDIKVWAERLRYQLDNTIQGSATWNPASIADGDEEAKEVTVTGAILGDFALASFSLDVTDLTLDAQVTASDTVTCILANNTGGAIDLAEGTLNVIVFRKGMM